MNDEHGNNIPVIATIERYNHIRNHILAILHKEGYGVDHIADIKHVGHGFEVSCMHFYDHESPYEKIAFVKDETLLNRIKEKGLGGDTVSTYDMVV